MKTFREICKQHTLKITPQRVAIYEAVMGDVSHPTAEAVYKKVTNACPNISFDTVNRTLISFAEIGILNPVECSGQGKKYDPNTQPHHHLKCVKCGIIIDFYNEEYDNIPVPKKVRKEFTVVGKKVVLTGRCKKCDKKK